MKKFLPQIEIALIVQFIISFLVLMLLNTAFVWFLLSGMLLASFYFIATIILVSAHASVHEHKKRGTPIILIAQVQLALAVTGIVFKVMSFPGSSTLLLVAAIALLFVSILLVMNQYDFSKVLIPRTLVLGLLAAFLYWIPLSTWIHFRYYKNPDYAEVYIKYLENPQDSSLKYNWMKLREETFSKK